MKKLLFILSLFFIITSCNKTPIITLSVDKEVISANGKEFVTFKVVSTDKHNNEEDVTNDCQIFFTDSKLELGSTTFSTTEPNSYSFYATYEDAVSNEVSITAIEVEEEPVVIPIILSASTDTITANGEDVITFTVMQDTVNVTNITEIFVNENLISGNVFKTETAGSYNVIAKLNDSIVSNQISFFAKEVENNEEPEKPIEPEDPIKPEEPVVIPIVLSASTDTITANGEDVITFTVMQDTVNVTNMTKIFVNENLISGNVFKTETAGSYNVIAKLNDSIVSNQISFFAKEVENNEEPEKPIEPEDPIKPEEPVVIPIVLSASTDTITANGEDVITFTVMQDTVNVTNMTKIFVNESLISGNVFKTETAGSYNVIAKLNDSIVSNQISFFAKEVENNEEPEKPIEPEDPIKPEEPVVIPIVLSASTDTITANGEDVITFTVMQDTVNVTNLTKIFVNESLISGNIFKTETAGSYIAYAMLGEVKSNEITITAEEKKPEVKPIVLTASKTTILNNGKDHIIFTVMQDNLDITTKTKIYVGETKLKLNVFTSKTAGTYTAYAMLGEVKSNEITITVEEEKPEEKPIVLTASKTNITADGNDAVTFTVKQENNDVTSETEIYVNDNKINGNTFTTTTAGTYKAYAKKGELKSNEISITAEAVVEPEKPIELIASTTNITANGSDAVTFTVMQENNDVTSQASIFVNNQKLASNVFTTYSAGTYTAYAQKNEVRSNEITINVEAVPDMGKSVVFAEGVSLTTGWYDVNKLKNGGGDINMCWAASASNIIQWWQDRYVEAGNTLPSTAVTGPGTKVYPEGYKYNLALMELYRDLWWNGKGGSTDHGVIWYFEGRNIQQYASEGSLAQPNDNTSGGYYSSIWNQILQETYHEYSYLSFSNLIAGEFNNYSIWGNGSGLQGNARLKKFSDLVVEFIDRGVVSFVISLNSNGGLLHATTLWGYEIDNATGMITKLWITDSDDMHQSGNGDPTVQMLREYSVSFDGSKVKLSGAPYGNCWAISLLPVSGYGSAK